VYRYAIFAHNFSEAPGRSGIAEFPGNDFLVTHALRDPGGIDFEQGAVTRATLLGTTFEAEWSDMQAGTFMHELGHTVGLTHGGSPVDATVNCKPNYLSVMNYTRQHRFVGFDATTGTQMVLARALDYSPDALPTLDEAALNESAGISGPAGAPFGFGQLAPTPGYFRIQDAAAPTDWNGANGIEGTPVSADINHVPFLSLCGPSPAQKLSGFDDWAALRYSFRSATDYKDGVTRQALESLELSDEDESAMLSGSIPPTIAITVPTDGARIASGMSVSVSVAANDADGSVTNVELIVDGVLVGSDAVAPYSFIWPGLSDGTHSIKVRGTDEDGAMASTAITVHVGCATALSSAQALPYTAGGSTLHVTLSDACQWKAFSDADWLSVSPSFGSGSGTLAYAADENWTESARSGTITVNEVSVTVSQDPAPAFAAPAALSATALKDSLGRPFISLSWSPVANVAYYEVAVQHQTGSFARTTAETSLLVPYDETIANRTYLFKVRAISSTAQVSPYSVPDIATVMSFTDDPIVPQATIIKAVHITELRAAINAVRALAGLSPSQFVVSVAVGGLVHSDAIAELRTALQPARSSLGLTSISYTDPSLGAGVIVRRAHVEELRNATN
jgi:hypothetical protein